MLNIFSDFLQVIDVLAASIEYGLDGLTKVIVNVCIARGAVYSVV